MRIIPAGDAVLSSLLKRCALPLLLMLAGCAATNPLQPPDFTSYVVLAEDGTAVARILIDTPACPDIVLNQRSQPMQLRAPAAAIPLLTCEAPLPAGVTSASVLGRSLPLPKAEPQRIVIIGDTGWQARNEIDQHPFATLAAEAAAWKPDLVIHLGDYLRRASACPEGNAGCAGSPPSDGWEAWDDDFFAPGARLLDAAPWIMARGSQESCQGYSRFLDPRPLLTGTCNAADEDVGIAHRLPAGVGNIAALQAWLDSGFVTLERRGQQQWQLQVHDLQGKILQRCQIDGSRPQCDPTPLK
jgi:hypothetical protein